MLNGKITSKLEKYLSVLITNENIPYPPGHMPMGHDDIIKMVGWTFVQVPHIRYAILGLEITNAP